MRENRQSGSQLQTNPPKRQGLGFFGATISVIVWLFLWTVFALVLWALLYSAVLENAGKMLSQTTEPFAAIAIFMIPTVALALILFLVAMVLRSFRRSRFLNIGRVVLLTCTWIGLLGMGGLFFASIPGFMTVPSEGSPAGQPIISDTRAVTDGAQDPQLLVYAQQVGAVYIQNLGMTYVASYSDPNRLGQYEWTYNSVTGEFVEGKITIKAGLSEHDTRTALAHEYLHHVWESRLDRPTRDNLTSHLISMHAGDPYMQRRVASYSAGGTLVPTELFAFYCTESSDGWLTVYVLEQCNTYINRGALVMVR